MQEDLLPDSRDSPQLEEAKGRFFAAPFSLCSEVDKYVKTYILWNRQLPL